VPALALERIEQTLHELGQLLARRPLAVSSAVGIRRKRYSALAAEHPRGERKRSVGTAGPVEQAKAQGFDNPQHAICPSCGTTPKLRQFGRYQCECGELEGFETG
jgi:hypothetical protein